MIVLYTVTIENAPRNAIRKYQNDLSGDRQTSTLLANLDVRMFDKFKALGKLMFDLLKAKPS